MPTAQVEPGPRFSVRALSSHDEPAFARFAAEISDGERRFLKEELDDVARGLAMPASDSRVRRLVAATEDNGILGLAGVFPGRGWSAHVAEVRVLVGAGHRRRGIGRGLARAALIEALALECLHAYVEVVAQQEGLVAMFQDLGFEPEALLADFVRDGAGEFHDLMLLTYRSDEQRGLRQVFGLDEVAS